MRLSSEVLDFFGRQNFVIITTVGKNGVPHNACKGIVKAYRDGRVYLLDLYCGRTYRNLSANPRMSLAAADEHRFRGYCLKGRGAIVPVERIAPSVMREWRRRMRSRITRRIIRSVQGDKGHPRHPEALLPAPKYLIALAVDEVVDLTPGHLK
ncbi:MAG: pyridoxamine 5'-phosphate oxidase family protein [bacterium]|nr:pyridoxamine 5'-phosphate oxidase family protein [bacterium]